MPSWQRTLLAPTTKELAPSASLVVDATGEGLGDGRYADMALAFIDIEFIDEVTVKVYRLGGPREDRLGVLDSTPVTELTQEGPWPVSWDTPPPPWLGLRLLLVAGASGGSIGLRVFNAMHTEEL